MSDFSEWGYVDQYERTKSTVTFGFVGPGNLRWTVTAKADNALSCEVLEDTLTRGSGPFVLEFGTGEDRLAFCPPPSVFYRADLRAMIRAAKDGIDKMEDTK